MEEKNTKKLTQEEIDFEIEKVGNFFKQVPDDLKAWTAERFIFEIVLWGSYNHYEALGIFQEAMQRYRNASLSALEQEEKEEGYENALENSKEYRCVKSIPEFNIEHDEVYDIGFACDNDNYGGGKKYLIFNEDGAWIDICQKVLDEHFVLVEEYPSI